MGRMGGILVLCGVLALGVPTVTNASPATTHFAGPMYGAALTSSNWAGYVVVGTTGSVSSIRGSWIQPAYHGTCSSTTQLAAFWVGIDGISSAAPTVEQAGTLIECIGSTVHYAAWWEFYPQNSVQIIGTIGVHAGDTIFASVTHSRSATFKIVVRDVTTGQNFTTSGSPPGAKELSAEWIAEAPCCSSSSTVYPLADFGTVLWGKNHTHLNGTDEATISGSTHLMGRFTNLTTDVVTMVSSTNATKALPSAISTDGSSFKVVWKSAGP